MAQRPSRQAVERKCRADGDRGRREGNHRQSGVYRAARAHGEANSSWQLALGPGTFVILSAARDPMHRVGIPGLERIFLPRLSLVCAWPALSVAEGCPLWLNL